KWPGKSRGSVRYGNGNRGGMQEADAEREYEGLSYRIRSLSQEGRGYFLSNGARSSVFSGRAEDGQGPIARCSFRAAGSKTIVCSVTSPWLTACSSLAMAGMSSFGICWHWVRISYRRQILEVASSLLRKWFVHRHSRFSGCRTITLLGVISKTAA